MKIIILGGFLGSGKTTIVLQLAQYLVNQTAQKGNQVIILENEIGQIGIDDMLLKSNGYLVSELFSGCACCTMAGELRGNVRKIQKDINPQWLLIEATGVAYPGNIREALTHIPNVSCLILTLVDCQRFLRLLRPAEALLRGQINECNFLLLTKTDLVSEDEIRKVTEKVRDYNSKAPLWNINGTLPIPEEYWKQILQKFSEKQEENS